MKRFRKSEGFTLIELLIVIIIIGILAAIAIPMFLNQRNKAKDASVKEGIHSLQVGIQTWSVDNTDQYPAVGDVAADGAVASYVDNWPQNPFASGDMKQAGTSDPGNYNYVVTQARPPVVHADWLAVQQSDLRRRIRELRHSRKGRDLIGSRPFLLFCSRPRPQESSAVSRTASWAK